MVAKQRTRQESLLFEKLKAALKADASLKTHLAFFIGLKTTNTIEKWLSRGGIPRIQERNVDRFLKEYKS